LHLVLTRKKFDELLKQEPETIGYTIYRDLSASIWKRVNAVPIHYRNYVLWGYSPPQLPEELDPHKLLSNFSKTATLALMGLCIGLLGAWTTVFVFKKQYQALALEKSTILLYMSACLAFVGSGVGGMLGWYYDHFEEWSLSERRHPRSCANCRFSVWK